MAKNYTIKEAVEIIVAGKDLEAITDLGRRYPILTAKVAALGAIAGGKFVEFMGYMPEYLTANKVNTVIKNGAQESEATDEDADDADTEETADDAEVTDGGKDYESMSGKELWDILGKAGLRKTAKSTKKADLVAACKAMDAGTATADAEEDVEDEAETEANPYEGKSAMELFKECKSRGIKAAPKKPAKFYADLLAKEDAKVTEAEADTEAEDDGWDETEEEAPKAPAKNAKATKGGKKAAAKPAAKAAKEEDDEDWDI